MDFRKLLDNFVLTFSIFAFVGFFVIFFQMFSGNLEKIVLKQFGYNPNNFSANIENAFPKKLQTNIESGIAVYLNENNQEILFEKNIDRVLPIASITKLLTALIVFENYDLSQKVIISKADEEMKGSLIAKDEYYVKDLLKIMMVQSDNSAAYALSGVIGQKEFVTLMNQRAKEIGMQNTFFDNSVGFGFKTTSTVQDLILLAKEILKKQPQIFELSLIKSLDLYDTLNNLKVEAKNINQLLFDDSIEFKNRIIGGKTGANPYAGECLLLIVKSFDNKGYVISVVLNAGSKIDDRFKETKKIINWIKIAHKWK